MSATIPKLAEPCGAVNPETGALCKAYRGHDFEHRWPLQRFAPQRLIRRTAARLLVKK